MVPFAIVSLNSLKMPSSISLSTGGIVSRDFRAASSRRSISSVCSVAERSLTYWLQRPGFMAPASNASKYRSTLARALAI